MIIINQAVEVPYTPTQIFEVVNDIQAYPEFVPFCKKGTIKTLQKDKVIEGSLTFAGLGFSETLKTRNILIRPYQIKIHLLAGPLSYLEGSWRFNSITAQKTQARLEIKFTFKYGWLERMLKPIFNTITHEALQAFVKRIEVCYGKPH